MRYPLFLIALFLPLLSSAQQFKLLKKLNSDARETNLSITPNGKYLFFMSVRGGQPWSTERKKNKKTGILEYDGDIWVSVNENGEWQEPQCLSERINTNDGEDEPNVTVDGQAVYFQSWRDNWQSTGGPYYRAELDGVVWKNPEGLYGEITRFFEELSYRTDKVFKRELREKKLYDDYLVIMKEERDSMSERLEEKGMDMSHYLIGTDGMAISPDEKIFVVATFIPETKKYDLFISRKNEDDIWTYPKSLEINTPADEISVFIAGDNKTMYFASDREGGSGGFDIYKTTLEGGTKCGEVINLGEPYNSEKDEYGFIVNSTSDEGFMITDGDIVQFDLNAKAKPQETVVINGRIIDEEGNPVEAGIELVNESQDISMNKSRSNNYTGEYSFSYAREEGRFNQLVTTTEGIVIEEPFEIEESTPNVLNFEIVIKKKRDDAQVVESLGKLDLQEGEIFRVDKLYFEADKAVIMSESYTLLDQVATILNDRKEVVIEVRGHTNNLPPDDYCDKLSTDRAEAVYTYLTEKGIEADRLQFKGYGKRRPIASNATLQGRKINQRVELKILEIRRK